VPVSISSCAGRCVWHVVARQRSVREWALKGWGGHPVRQEQARGILIAALGMLAGHFGYAEAAWSNDEPGAVGEAPWVPKRSNVERGLSAGPNHSEAMTIFFINPNALNFK
jgi:hypothetical protein